MSQISKNDKDDETDKNTDNFFAEKDEKGEEMQEATTINFSIKNCPMAVYQEFSRYCKKETSDNYSFGLRTLLESRKANIKEALLFQQYVELKERIEKLEAAVSKLASKNANRGLYL